MEDSPVLTKPSWSEELESRRALAASELLRRLRVCIEKQLDKAKPDAATRTLDLKLDEDFRPVQDELEKVLKEPPYRFSVAKCLISHDEDEGDTYYWVSIVW